MELAFSTNAFRKYALEDTIEFLAGIGYRGVEIMCDIPHAYPPQVSAERLLSIKETLRKHGMIISNLNAFMLTALGDFHHPSWIEADPYRRILRVEYTRQCINLAADLGAKTISTEPGGPLEGLTRQEAMGCFLQGLSSLSSYAQSKGVRILVEPEPHLLIETSEQFLEFIAGVDREVIGLNLDIGHFYCVNEDPVEVVKKLARYIGHVHIEDIAPDREHRHLPPGQGAIDLPGVLRALHEVGYNGMVTVELYPFQENSKEVALAALKYLQPLLP